MLDCQNGIPFFTPLVLPRRVPVLCVMHHVHTAQFGVHFPGLDGPGRAVARRPGGPAGLPAAGVRGGLAVDGRRDAGPAALDRRHLPDPQRFAGAIAGRTAAAGAGRPGSSGSAAWSRTSGPSCCCRWPSVAERGFAIDVIGRGPDGAALAAAVAAAGLADAVRLHGFLADRDKREIVAGSLLHLNTSQGEGWGLCVLEAAALGVPTVAYDVEGLRDAVRDGETGWLVQDGEQLERRGRAGGQGTGRPGPPGRGRGGLPRLGRPAELGPEPGPDGGAGRGVRAGRDRAGQPGWCVGGVGPAGPGSGPEAVAEGPVLDALISRRRGAAPARPRRPSGCWVGRPGPGGPP